jgi:hypothetical protein
MGVRAQIGAAEPAAGELDELVATLASLNGLDDELAPLRALDMTLPIEPLETSISLGAGSTRDLRLTVGLLSRADDPESQTALGTLLGSLGFGPMAEAAVAALARAARGARERRFAYGAALRARPGRTVRPRPAAWLGGNTVAERTTRIAEALVSLGLDEPARTSERIVGTLSSNPFSAVIPYALGLGLHPEGGAGAKVYVACESAEVALDHLHGPVADELDLGDRTAAFDALVEITRPEWRCTRWLLEASFELPADPAAGPRAKLYVPPAGLASDVTAHRAIMRLAAELGLDPGPYEALLGVLRPDELSPDHPPTLMLGVSVTAERVSLEAYIFVHSWYRVAAQSGREA